MHSGANHLFLESEALMHKAFASLEMRMVLKPQFRAAQP